MDSGSGGESNATTNSSKEPEAQVDTIETFQKWTMTVPARPAYKVHTVVTDEKDTTQIYDYK